MFKILVADDEMFIRKGILSILNRNLDEPVKCVEAKNGIEALRKTKEEKPDLVITDINMPGCDGLEFVKVLKESHVRTTVIILSGHENFEYAKRAMALGIKEYVMKPIKKAEFIALIQRYMVDIRQQQQKSQEDILKKIEMNRIIEKLKKDFLIGLLKCTNNKEAHQYLEQLNELKLNFEPQLCTCVAFQYEVNDENQSYIDFVVKNILDEYLSLELEDFLLNVAYDDGKIISIFKCSSTNVRKGEWKKIIRRGCRIIQKYAKVRVFAGMGDVAPDFEHLNGAFRHALCAVEYKIFDKGDILYAYDEIEKEKEMQLPKLQEQDNILEIWGELNRIYKMGQTQAVMDALKSRYNETLKFIQSQMAKKAAASERQEIVYREFSFCWTIAELKQEIKKGLDKLEAVNKEMGTINACLIEQVIQFVDENITKDLDLAMVADQFNRSPGYISTMFKRYAEGGFNTYITEKRMGIAKNLLRTKRLPIQEVAEACGYNNAKYFSVVFKKTVGQTPREYRENI